MGRAVLPPDRSRWSRAQLCLAAATRRAKSYIDLRSPQLAATKRDRCASTQRPLTIGRNKGPTLWDDCPASPTAAARAQFGCVVCITSSRSSSSSGTKPLPPHVGHCRSSSVPFSTTPSPLQSGQVFMGAPHGDATTPLRLYMSAYGPKQTCRFTWTPSRVTVRIATMSCLSPKVFGRGTFACLKA